MPNENNGIKFQGCKVKVKLFPEKRKNRRLTPYEMQDELFIAKWLHRPPRTYFDDTPFYPWLPPEPVVNFKLNYTE